MPTLDRERLKSLADLLLESMAKRDATLLPLARTYAMTKNNGPSSPGMADIWRTVTGYKAPADFQYVIDTPAQQVFVTAEVDEGGVPALLWGRLKAEDELITEIELYMCRSNGDSGFMFDPTGLRNMPKEWTASVPDAQKASRERLTEIARCVFDPGLGTPETSQEGYLVENGERVMGDITVEKMRELLPWATKEMFARVEREHALPKEYDKPGYASLLPDKSRHAELIGLGCDLMADRPADDHARILVDEVQGIVVSLGMVPGHTYPSFYWWYPILETAFVPESMLLDNQSRRENADSDPSFDPNVGRDLSLPYIPLSKPVPAVLSTAEVYRFFDGRIQGEHRLMQIQPAGSTSPWTVGE
ncbi:hypothetical protein ACFY6U_51680 [Streptomyces sp. NPDC013157]|uniref:hypothetical protein n=1 Tax=Streptomyces sp. NPDC013157 TaxID=3364861 RepID=UPI00368D8EA2